MLVREAVRNVVGRRSRVSVLLVGALVCGSAVALVQDLGWRSFEAELAELEMRGRNVLVARRAEAEAEVTFSRASCERLASAEHVVRAGPLEPLDTRDVLQLGPAVGVVGSSETLFAELGDVDVIIGASLRASGEEGGGGAPSTLAVEGLGVGQAATGKTQPVGVDTNSAVVVRLAPEVTRVTTCVLVIERHVDPGEMAVMVAGQLDAAGGPVMVRPAIELSHDPLEMFEHRSERFVPLLLGAVLALCAAAMYRFRMPELATYLASGTSRRSLLLLIALEHALIGGVVAASGALAVVVLSGWLLRPELALFHAAAAGVTYLVCALLGTVWSAVGRPTDVLKER